MSRLMLRRVVAGIMPFLFVGLAQIAAAPIEKAPAPRVIARSSPAEYDRALMAEIKANSELMKNLQYLSDVIGPRLTGSKNLERANKWAEEKMKGYGLENVHLEPWEVPVGWERGTASLKIVEPETGVSLSVAAKAWTPGTEGKVTGEVIVVTARNKADLDKYRGKLKNASVMLIAPTPVAPVTDLRYGPGGAPRPKKDVAKKDEPKKDVAKKDEPKKDVAKKDELKKDVAKKDEAKKDQPRKGGGGQFNNEFRRELTEFLKAEGAACQLGDAGKPHGLLNMTGGWRAGDRGTPQDILPTLYVAHEHYAMLYRLATRPAPAVTKVEVEVSNKFIPGPIVVYNTVGEVKGAEMPDEVVVVGAHLDSWDLGTGTTDNGTGSCVVLETARAVAALAARGQKPKRTIRFILFTGEEQGLHGSKQYVTRHKEELAKISAAVVHDTGTGRVIGFGTNGRENVQKILEPEFETLRTIDGWAGMDLGTLGGTDHLSFEAAGVPGFAFRQDTDEYRLTHHTQSDTFDHAKAPELLQGAQVMAITATRIANLPEMLPRRTPAPMPMTTPPKKVE